MVLVGGMTRMPKHPVSRSQGFFEKRAEQGRPPGRGRRARRRDPGIAALVDDKQEMVLLDVTPHALGIMTFGSVLRGADPAEHDGADAPARRSSRRAATTRRR